MKRSRSSGRVLINGRETHTQTRGGCPDRPVERAGAKMPPMTLPSTTGASSVSSTVEWLVGALLSLICSPRHTARTPPPTDEFDPLGICSSLHNLILLSSSHPLHSLSAWLLGPSSPSFLSSRHCHSLSLSAAPSHRLLSNPRFIARIIKEVLRFSSNPTVSSSEEEHNRKTLIRQPKG